MMRFWFLAGLFSVTLLGAGPAAQGGRAVSSAPLPPLSQTCPMHPDVVESAPGNCPICRMKLVPVRLETIWACPVHADVAETSAGTCPIDHRDLIQMTVALTWTCAEDPGVEHLERGTCAGGKPMAPKRTLRPHGNHNPQHGGQFFMAPDNFHHVEGAYPRARVFRLYLYDDYARPLPAAEIRRITARVVTNERFDSATRTTTEVSKFVLVPHPGYLEARVDTASMPAAMTAKVQFKRDAPEVRFDFTFPAFSRQPAAPCGAGLKPCATGTATPSTRVAVVPGPPAPTTMPEPAAPQPAVDPSLVPLPIPDTVQEIRAQLETRGEQVGELIRRGDFTAVYVPAFQARDLAIALESRLADLPAARREAAEPAINRLVRTAWLLDAFGDLGNRQQITEAYTIFSSAVADVIAAFQ